MHEGSCGLVIDLAVDPGWLLAPFIVASFNGVSAADGSELSLAIRYHSPVSWSVSNLPLAGSLYCESVFESQRVLPRCTSMVVR